MEYFTSILVRKSLDLIESLLRLAEVGQYEPVKQLFSFPIKHCPDMLVMALLQINSSWHTMRHELISTLMPIFLGNHPNSAIILHYAWHGQVRHELFFIGWRSVWEMVNLSWAFGIVPVSVLQDCCLTLLFLGTVSLYPPTYHACNGRMVHARGALWPGQIVSNTWCSPGLEGELEGTG